MRNRSGRERDWLRFNDWLGNRLLNGSVHGRWCLSWKGGSVGWKRPFGDRRGRRSTVLFGIVFGIEPAALPLDFFLAGLFLVGLELRPGLRKLLKLCVELALHLRLCRCRRGDWLRRDWLWLVVVLDCRGKVRQLLEHGLERILVLGWLVDDNWGNRSLRRLPFAQGELQQTVCLLLVPLHQAIGLFLVALQHHREYYGEHTHNKDKEHDEEYAQTEHSLAGLRLFRIDVLLECLEYWKLVRSASLSEYAHSIRRCIGLDRVVWNVFVHLKFFCFFMYFIKTD